MATILAVDDSMAMLQMVTFTLKAAGHTVIKALDGEEAYNIATQQEFDLIISDINMPKKDGLQLLAELRELDSYKGVPIILLTTENATEMKAQGKTLGATGWLVKPFKPETLIAIVSKLVNTGGQ